MSMESDFSDKLKLTFRGEADEHLAALSAGLQKLESDVDGSIGAMAVIDIISREIHSLKGAARAVASAGIESICQAVENIFYSLKKGLRKLDQPICKTLYSSFDLMAALADDKILLPESEVQAMLKRLNELAEESPGSIVPTPEPPVKEALLPRRVAAAMSETVRISAGQLGSIFLKAEEMVSFKQVLDSQVSEISKLKNRQLDWNNTWLRVIPALKKNCPTSGSTLEAMTKFLESCKANAVNNATRLDSLSSAMILESLHIGEKVEALLAELKTALMLPFSVLLESFPRMVRDLATEEEKQADWQVLGTDIQIDRRVLEEIKDPLIHIARNCVSHGIEKPLVRQNAGKPPCGLVSLDIVRIDNDKLEFTLSDDGAGIDPERLKTTAVRLGMIKPDAAAAMSEQEALDLIFLSDFSTCTVITDISGRGLGLAIAREKIWNIGGLLSVSSVLGKGTTFFIQIPLSLSTYRGVVIHVSGRTFIVPTASVDQVMRISNRDVIQGEFQKTIIIDGRSIYLSDLSSVLGIGDSVVDLEHPESILIIIMLVSGSRIAFRIDDVSGEQEVLTKNLGRQLRRVRNISGATLLPGGEVVPILNPVDLIKSASLLSFRLHDTPAAEYTAKQKNKILVVDDSITSRTLLKAMLESSGYLVVTAVDGVDAFRLLLNDTFDLLISDIEMPKMDGIALCRLVRGHVSMADLPIILVTSLGSHDDLERGIAAGASAYIAKAGFDQSKLLEVVSRLL